MGITSGAAMDCFFYEGDSLSSRGRAFGPDAIQGFGNARKITNGGRKVIGSFMSRKNGIPTPIRWESPLEADFIHLLEIDPAVLAYVSQPLRIRCKYTVNGKNRRFYTPDFMVVRAGKIQIIEVKPYDKAIQEEYIILFKTVAPIFKKMGYEFKVVTDRFIRQEPRLGNVKLLHRYAWIPITTQHQILCMEFFRDQTSALLHQFEEFMKEHNVGRDVVYGLLYQGILDTDLTCLLRGNSSVRLTELRRIPSERY